MKSLIEYINENINIENTHTAIVDKWVSKCDNFLKKQKEFSKKDVKNFWKDIYNISLPYYYKNSKGSNDLDKYIKSFNLLQALLDHDDGEIKKCWREIESDNGDWYKFDNGNLTNKYVKVLRAGLIVAMSDTLGIDQIGNILNYSYQEMSKYYANTLK